MSRVSGRGWRRATVAIVVAAVAVAGVIAASHTADEPPVTALQRGNGGSAADFELPDLRAPSETISLSDFAGRPVVVNFWASWCVPCRTEMPALAAVHRRLQGQVEFIGVNHQDSRKDALEFLADSGVSYPSGYDPAGDVARRYSVFGLPTTLFIAADGTVEGRRTGEMSEAELEATIDDLLLG